MIVGGIFVGGASRRMGGRAKGLLRGPDGRPLVERARAILAEVCDEVVLVGARPEYEGLGLTRIEDDPPGVGPIGGLAALLARAPAGRALALACDMPFVTADDLRALVAAEGTAAPRRDGRWEPLSAIYDATALEMARARIAAGQHGLQGLLHALHAGVVAIEPEHLRDWDTPEDVA